MTTGQLAANAALGRSQFKTAPGCRWNSETRDSSYQPGSILTPLVAQGCQLELLARCSRERRWLRCAHSCTIWKGLFRRANRLSPEGRALAARRRPWTTFCTSFAGEKGSGSQPGRKLSLYLKQTHNCGQKSGAAAGALLRGTKERPGWCPDHYLCTLVIAHNRGRWPRVGGKSCSLPSEVWQRGVVFRSHYCLVGNRKKTQLNNQSSPLWLHRFAAEKAEGGSFGR